MPLPQPHCGSLQLRLHGWLVVPRDIWEVLVDDGVRSLVEMRHGDGKAFVHPSMTDPEVLRSAIQILVSRIHQLTSKEPS